MKRKYWLESFTGKTWEEFLKNGGNVSGFRETRKNLIEEIEPGDYIICYITGISRFIGVLEVKSKWYFNKVKIWEDADFPCRFKVEIIYKLKPEISVPVLELKDKLSIFENLKSPKAWTGFFRSSPGKFKNKDAETIIQAIINYVNHPIEKEYDKSKNL